MSVKLYDAWRMPVMPLPKFQKWLDDIRVDLRKISDEKILKEIARRAIHRYDMMSVSPNRAKLKKESSGLIGIWSEVFDEYKKVKKTGERNPIVDVECEIIFHFRGQFIYMVMITEQQEYKDYLEALPNIEEYGYWDNTDRPANITSQQWRQRQKVWDAAFGSKPMCFGGLTFTLVGDYELPIPHRGTIEPFFLDWDRRVKEMLREIVISEHFPEEITVYNILRTFEWYKEDPEAQKLKEDLRPKIESMMKRDLTFEDLNS